MNRTHFSIKEFAQTLRLSPQKLLQTLRDAGIEKDGFDDIVSPAERNKLMRVLTPDRGQGTRKWSGSGGKRTPVGSGASPGQRGSARKVPVKVKKKSIRINQEGADAGRGTGTAPKVATRLKPGEAAQEVVAKSPSPAKAAGPNPKRVFSAETKKMIKGAATESAHPPAPEDAQQAVSALPSSEPPSSEGQVIADSGSPGEAAPISDVDTSDETKPVIADKEATTTSATESADKAAQRKGSKAEFPARKRQSSRRGRIADIEDDDFSFQDGIEDIGEAETTQATNDDRVFGPGSYLHIKKSFRKRRKVKTQTSQKKENIHGFRAPIDRISLKIELPEQIAVIELARRLQIKRNELMSHINSNGLEVDNDSLDQVSAALIVENLGHKAILQESDSPIVRAKNRLQYRGDEVLVPPVVTIMGHVDHGKTTLIDHLRKSQVVSGEYGAITQHIGAYRVPVRNGEFISFLDTPGHAAFANMRERGARVTDIIVLVVAADDGVKPQTVESIDYAKQYKIPIVVAVNKIDKDNANPELVRKDLAELEIVPEDWGGEHQFVEISALKGKGISDLLEALHLQSEIIDKKVPCDGDGFGYVIESGQRKGIGITATVLLRKGAIKNGQIVSAGQSWGRVRFMLDEDNNKIKELTPGLPATLVGLNQVVESGSEIFVTSEPLAKEIELYSRQQTQSTIKSEVGEIDADALFADLEKKSRIKTVNLYIKTDVQGSTDAVKKILDGVNYPEFHINVVACRQGGIYDSDVQTAASTQSIIIGFNVNADSSARKLAETMGVELQLHRSVYEIFDFVESVALKQIEPVIEYTKVGEAKVREIFRSSAFGSVAGCLIVDGAVHKNDVIRIIRDTKQIFEGRLDSLRRFKDDVQVVNTGSECGIAVKKFNDLQENDIIEAFKTKEVLPTATKAEPASASSA